MSKLSKIRTNVFIIKELRLVSEADIQWDLVKFNLRFAVSK